MAQPFSFLNLPTVGRNSRPGMRFLGTPTVGTSPGMPTGVSTGFNFLQAPENNYYLGGSGVPDTRNPIRFVANATPVPAAGIGAPATPAPTGSDVSLLKLSKDDSLNARNRALGERTAAAEREADTLFGNYLKEFQSQQPTLKAALEKDITNLDTSTLEGQLAANRLKAEATTKSMLDNLKQQKNLSLAFARRSLEGTPGLIPGVASGELASRSAIAYDQAALPFLLRANEIERQDVTREAEDYRYIANAKAALAGRSRAEINAYLAQLNAPIETKTKILQALDPLYNSEVNRFLNLNMIGVQQPNAATPQFLPSYSPQVPSLGGVNYPMPQTQTTNYPAVNPVVQRVAQSPTRAANPQFTDEDMVRMGYFAPDVLPPAPGGYLDPVTLQPAYV